MKIPKSFKEDIELLYNGKIDENVFIVKHTNFLKKLAKHAIRFPTMWTISDEEDMFQEAWYWLIRSLWEYDENRNTELARYVVYNIGARLKACIRHEKNIKRHPPENIYRMNIWESYKIDYKNENCGGNLECYIGDEKTNCYS